MPISKLLLVRSTVIAILVGLAALLAIVGTDFWLVSQAAIYSDTVTSARLKRSTFADLSNMLDNSETGQRGYLLTGDKDYQAPYLEAQQKIPEQLAQARTLTRGNAVESNEVAKLTPIVAAKLAELRRVIEMYDAGSHDEATATIKSNVGRNLMDDARKLIASLVLQADAEIGQAVKDQRESITALKWVTIFGALVIVLVVGGSIWTVLLYMRQLAEAQREVQTLNAGLEERVRERTADLGRANEEIQRFAYIVTHDLRAPLVNIMGFTSELEGCLASIQNYVPKAAAAGDDPKAIAARTAALEELPEAINFIRSSTRKMDGLINAILKLSREGRRALKPEPIGLEALLKTAAANLQHQVNEAGGDVEIDVRVPQVVSDRLALEQIFGNLLDNAVKYRAPNRPLKISVRAKEARGQNIVVEVADNGRGIAKQDQERVFDLFRRSGPQDLPGEGIGLAHVRAMVRNLGGDISLQSELEQGTTMKLHLPRDLRRVTSSQTGAASRGPAS